MARAGRFIWLIVAAASLAFPLAYDWSALAEERPNVLLIVVDTLGAKHAGGAAGRISGFSDLASTSVVFERAYSTSSWTQPAIASMLCSLSPSRHGVTALFDKVSPEILMLAEALMKAGYFTKGIASHTLLGSRFGFDQGFTSYEQVNTVKMQDAITSKIVTEKALEELERWKTAPGKRFLFLHYFDPHHVYHDHPELTFSDPYGGPAKKALGVPELRKLRETLSEDQVGHSLSLYREEVEFTGRHIAAVLERLSALGLREKTLVVLTADHGEEFREHGWFGHTHSLYEELIRVPLMISAPGAAHAGKRAEPVSILDIMPTILDFSGARAPDMEGISLRPYLTPAAPPAREERTLFAEVGHHHKLELKRSNYIAAIRPPYKLIKDRHDGSYELFDLDKDPGEQSNIHASRPELAEPLKKSLSEHLQGIARHRKNKATVTPRKKEIQQLESLGYL